MIDLNLVRWVALLAGLFFIALCYRKNAKYAELAFWAACSLWIYSMADLCITFGHPVIVLG